MKGYAWVEDIGDGERTDVEMETGPNGDGSAIGTPVEGSRDEPIEVDVD